MLKKKEIKDLMSLVANAIATNTISEAEDYIVERYQGELDDEFIQHAFAIMDNKQSEINT